ncbi:MAG: hypothetical protein IJZ66_02225 [Oscillibacter sp.]|nr:hypothetical protein [Oscillibacter sp.]
MAEKYRYTVKHPEYGVVEVEASERLYAVSAAAKKWGVPWTHIARECWCERGEPVGHREIVVKLDEAAEQKLARKPARKRTGKGTRSK